MASALLGSLLVLMPTLSAAIVLPRSTTVHGSGVPDWPMIMCARGCVGSTWAGDTFKQLLKKHGLTPLEWVGDKKLANELMKPVDNPLIHEGDSQVLKLKALLKLHRIAARQGKVFYFKGCPHGLVAKELLRLKARAFYLSRDQLLDRVVCNVNDFPSNRGGWRVDELGNEIKKSRRFDDSSGIKTKVFLNSSMLPKTLKQLGGSGDSDWFRSEGFTGCKTVTSEDISAYEYSIPRGLQRSVTAWSDVFASMGLVPNQTIIESYLRGHGFNSRKLEPHSETIANFQEVATALNDVGPHMRTYYRVSSAGFFQEKSEAECD